MSPKDYEEKRLFRRIPLEMPVKYAPTSTPDQLSPATGRDLSAGGMALICSERLAVGSEILLIIDSDSESYPPLTATAEVRRVLATSNELYATSVIFHKLS